MDIPSKYSSKTKEELIKIIDELEIDIKNTKKYGLVWDKENTKEKVVLDCENNIPILKFDDSKKIVLGTNNNVLIEGDNFHALTSLSFVLKESIDVIYIDPPYNTGNKDFIYNDKFIDEEDGYRHSKWLSFMEKRLRLARELLKDDGIIFISIDDNEQANLKLLCNQIFNEHNFIQMFLWNKNSGGTSLSKFTRSDYEYVMCYSKNLNTITHEFLGKFSEGMGDSSLINMPNKFSRLFFPKNSIKFISINNGLIKKGKYSDLELYEDLKIENHYNAVNVNISCKRKWSQEKLFEELKNGTMILSKTDNLRLRYIKNNKGSIIKPTKSISNKDKVGFTVSGSSELNAIINNSFSFPKPVSLLKYLVNMCSYWNNTALILDFFAGSGTTGQAVLELNKEDGGDRRFILCTNNENNICTNVTYPRLKTVITGIREDGSKYSEGIPSNLYYLKTDFVEDCNNKDQAKYNLVEKVDSLLCILEDIYERKECNDYSSHYSSIDNNKHLFIYNEYYNKEKFDEFMSRVNKEKGEKIVYIFSSDNEVDESLNKYKNIVFKSIPSKIYEIYKEIAEGIKREE